MGKKEKPPIIGTTCPALMNENYDYHLSGDCLQFCRCILNDKRCLGFHVDDPNDQSTQFFSRGVNVFDKEKIKMCPVYGSSKEIITMILRDKNESELKIKINNISKSNQNE